MARPRKGTGENWTTHWGTLIGQALGEGLAEGLQGSFARVREEFGPLAADLMGQLVQELKTEQAAAIAVEALEARRCEVGGCEARPVARNLCRRHYARHMYQERKARTPVREARRGGGRVRPVREGDEMAVKKVVAPVPPVVRRRKNGEEEAVAAKPQLTVVPSVPAEQGKAEPVLVDQVARFLGLKTAK